MVVPAEDGVDEIAIAAETRVIEVSGRRDRGVVRRAGGARRRRRRCRGDRRRDARRERRDGHARVLDGERGPARDVVAAECRRGDLRRRRRGGPRRRRRARARGNRLRRSARRARPPSPSSARELRRIASDWLACCADELARRAGRRGARGRPSPTSGGLARRRSSDASATATGAGHSTRRWCVPGFR